MVSLLTQRPACNWSMARASATPTAASVNRALLRPGHRARSAEDTRLQRSPTRAAGVEKEKCSSSNSAPQRLPAVERAGHAPLELGQQNRDGIRLTFANHSAAATDQRINCKLAPMSLTRWCSCC